MDISIVCTAQSGADKSSDICQGLTVATPGRSQATPLSAWLRVPLEWHRSSTHAFQDDETHHSIRRCYTSPHEQHAKRHFCGFCGTPLSYWTESPASEADFISLTLGTLSGDKLRDLEDLGLLPREATAEIIGADKDHANVKAGDEGRNQEVRRNQGLPWFDSMVEGSILGNMKRTMEMQTARAGRTVHVEWEIVEWTAGEEDDGDSHENTDAPNPVKRKLDDILQDDNGSNDAKMEGTH